MQRFLPFDWGVPTGRRLNIMMNRIDPNLFAACFTDWVRDCWPEPLDAIAIDGKTVRRSHDRAKGRAALHLVSAFAARSGLVLGQEAVDSLGIRGDAFHPEWNYSVVPRRPES